MTKQPLNFQDSFLNQVRKESHEIKVVMTNGASIIGIVKGFDNFTIMLQSRNSQHLLYKHAIAQMISRRHDGRKSEDGTDDIPTGQVSSPASDATPAGEHQDNSRPRPPRENRDGRDNRANREKKDSFNRIDLSGLSSTSE